MSLLTVIWFADVGWSRRRLGIRGGYARRRLGARLAPAGQRRFATVGTRSVDLARFEPRGQVPLLDPAPGIVVGIAVADARAEARGAAVVGVAQVRRHGGAAQPMHRLIGPRERPRPAVGLGGERTVERGPAPRGARIR